jgi:peptidoglycan-associated lipoprotein
LIRFAQDDFCALRNRGRSYLFTVEKEENMGKSWITGNLILAFVGLVMASCTPTAAKPEAQPPPASAPAVPGKKAVQTARQTAPSSSLEAHREGKAPAAGPLKELFFDFDKYDLTAAARATLQAHAAWLKANPSARVEIEGHCDERGTTEYNLALGAKRARAARDYLVSLGIPPARISTTSFGEELPACKEMTEGCYQKNRRDRFVVIGARPTS